jgi:hypothetical protein
MIAPRAPDMDDGDLDGCHEHIEHREHARAVDKRLSCVHGMFLGSRRIGKPMFLIHNERTKLMANWFNALAAALVTAGVFAPIVALFYRLSPVSADGSPLLLVTFGCIAGGVSLHWLGRALLGRLRE